MGIQYTALTQIINNVYRLPAVSISLNHYNQCGKSTFNFIQIMFIGYALDILYHPPALQAKVSPSRHHCWMPLAGLCPVLTGFFLNYFLKHAGAGFTLCSFMRLNKCHCRFWEILEAPSFLDILSLENSSKFHSSVRLCAVRSSSGRWQWCFRLVRVLWCSSRRP